MLFICASCIYLAWDPFKPWVSLIVAAMKITLLLLRSLQFLLHYQQKFLRISVLWGSMAIAPTQWSTLWINDGIWVKLTIDVPHQKNYIKCWICHLFCPGRHIQPIASLFAGMMPDPADISVMLVVLSHHNSTMSASNVCPIPPLRATLTALFITRDVIHISNNCPLCPFI